MNDEQRRYLVFKAQELEMEAHDLGNRAAAADKAARDRRAEQHSLLEQAKSIREGIGGAA